MGRARALARFSSAAGNTNDMSAGRGTRVG